MISLMATREMDVLHGLLLLWGLLKASGSCACRLYCPSCSPRGSSLSEAWRWALLVAHSLEHMHTCGALECAQGYMCRHPWTQRAQRHLWDTWEHRTYIDTWVRMFRHTWAPIWHTCPIALLPGSNLPLSFQKVSLHCFLVFF